VPIDSAPVDLIDTERPRLECSDRHRRCDQHVHIAKQLHETIAQLRAAIGRLDIVDAAILAASRNHAMIVAVRARELALLPARHRSRLLGIGNRFDRALERFGVDARLIGDDLTSQISQDFNRLSECLAHIGRDRGKSEIRGICNANASERRRYRIERALLHRQACGIANIVTGNHLQQQRDVAHRATDRPSVRQRSP